MNTELIQVLQNGIQSTKILINDCEFKARFTSYVFIVDSAILLCFFYIVYTYKINIEYYTIFSNLFGILFLVFILSFIVYCYLTQSIKEMYNKIDTMQEAIDIIKGE